MAVNLAKGERINLTKEIGKLTNVIVALGWDEATSGRSIDCDSFVIALRDAKLGLFNKSKSAKLKSESDVVYFGNKIHNSKCIVHHGDNLTGRGDGDDEIISVKLEDMPGDIKELVFGINIYDCCFRGQHFGMIKNCYVRIIDDNSRREICRYNLTDDYNDYTALEVGKLIKEDGEWHFKAVGKGTKDMSIDDFLKRFK